MPKKSSGIERPAFTAPPTPYVKLSDDEFARIKKEQETIIVEEPPIIVHGIGGGGDGEPGDEKRASKVGCAVLVVPVIAGAAFLAAVLMFVPRETRLYLPTECGVPLIVVLVIVGVVFEVLARRK